MHFTLIQSAKRHGIDPFDYLRDTLLRVTTQPGTGPPNTSPPPGAFLRITRVDSLEYAGNRNKPKWEGG